ncbi:MAG: hypothetical protein U0903_06620 [Planctomycetales bacterium]
MKQFRRTRRGFLKSSVAAVGVWPLMTQMTGAAAAQAKVGS